MRDIVKAVVFGGTDTPQETTEEPAPRVFGFNVRSVGTAPAIVKGTGIVTGVTHVKGFTS